MKRLLLFLALFGTGIAVLWFLEDPAALEEESSEEEPTAPDEPDAPSEEEDPEPQVGISLGGWFGVTLYDEETGRASMRLESEESRTEDEFDILEDVNARMFEPESDGQDVSVSLKAKHARVRRKAVDEELQPDYDKTAIEFFEASGDVLSGAPVVPLHFETSAAQADLVGKVLRSDHPIKLTSPELNADGTGYVLDVDEGSLHLDRDARVEVRHEKAPVVLESRGPLDVVRLPGEGPQPLSIDAVEGASLHVYGELEAHLDADRVHIETLTPQTPDGAIRIEQLTAEGNVVCRIGEHEFRGERAELIANDAGEITEARLFGFPVARLSFAPSEEEPDRPADEPRLPSIELVRVAGESEMTLRWATGVSFDVDGPATVETEGIILRSNGPVTGRADKDPNAVDLDKANLETAHLEASAGVVLEAEGTTLETADLILDLSELQRESATVRATASGGARLVGVLPSEREYTMTTPDTLVVERRDAAWNVVEATQVVLTATDESGEPVRARADRVLSFDPETLTFDAEGDIALEGSFDLDEGQFTATGALLRVLGRDHFVLTGSAEDKAVLDGPQGRAKAVEIEVEAGRVHARGLVEATVSLGTKGRHELTCGELELIRTESIDPLTGAPARTFAVIAKENVHADSFLDEETTVIDCAQLGGVRVEEFVDEDGTLVLVGATTTLVAEGDVRSKLQMASTKVDVNSDYLRVDRQESGDALDPEAEPASEHSVTARGNVRLWGRSGVDFEGEGHLFVLDHTRAGSLEPLEGERVFARGALSSHGTPFELSGDRIDFAEDRIEATSAEMLFSLVQGQPTDIQNYAARSHHLIATPQSLDLVGDVRIERAALDSAPWVLHAGRVHFEGTSNIEERTGELRGLAASDGVTLELGTSATAFGESLTADSISLGTLRLAGSPARVTTRLFATEAEWIEFDPAQQLVTATGRGTLSPTEAEAEAGGWKLDYLSALTLVEPDNLIYVLQEPTFRYPESDSELRSSWVVMWIDRRKWLDLASRDEGEEMATEELRVTGESLELGQMGGTAMGRLFGMFNSGEVSNLLRETYFEGPIEAVQEGQLMARADALYLDVVAGHGWISNATLHFEGRLLGQDFEKLIVKADWLRHSKDGSLRADSATVTPCDQEEPHVRIVTGDLRITPTAEAGGDAVYEVSLRDSRLEFYDKLKLPLPPINYSSDEDYRPLWQTLRIADTARYGTFVSAGVVRPAGRLGKLVNGVVGGSPFDYDAHYRLDASYLGSRGALFDLGLELRSNAKNKYWLDLYAGGLPDGGRDRGFIRVPEDDRDRLRLWYRANGRFVRSEEEWIDVRVSTQTDPGVQSEFYESEFIRYEQDESFLHWRKARGNNYYDASVKKRLDTFRAQIEELPSIGFFHGRAPLTHMGDVPLLYTSNTRAEYLRRREGDPPAMFGGVPRSLQSPFGLPDGLAEHNTMRFDTSHRVEAPIPLGFAGMQAIPFGGARFTAWSNDSAYDRHPTRTVAEAGVRLAANFWRANSNETISQVAPFVEFRGDVVHEENDGTPVRLDAVENSLEGNFLDLGVRARFGVRDEGWSRLDVEVRSTRASSLPSGVTDGWRPLAVFARLQAEPFDRPLEVWYDTRYDLEEKRTIYSLANVATRFTDDLRFEAGHLRGLDPAGVPLFEAATITGIWTWTEKWEFEGRQTFSLLNDEDLDTRFTIRRFGHDIVFELESSFREGEGSSVGVSVRPRFGYKPDRIGFLNY